MRLLIAGAFLLSLTGTSLAQAPASGPEPSTASQAISPADAQKLRDDMAALAAAMGVSPTSPPDAARNAESSKSPADVADRALNMVQGLVAQVSTSLEAVAPKVWGIMVRQQYAKAIFMILTPLLLFLGFLGFYKFGAKMALKHKDDRPTGGEFDYQFCAGAVQVISFAVMVVMTIWFSINMSDSAKYAINPEYYAVRDILVMITNPGSIK